MQEKRGQEPLFGGQLAVSPERRKSPLGPPGSSCPAQKPAGHHDAKYHEGRDEDQGEHLRISLSRGVTRTTARRLLKNAGTASFHYRDFLKMEPAEQHAGLDP